TRDCVLVRFGLCGGFGRAVGGAERHGRGADRGPDGAAVQLCFRCLGGGSGHGCRRTGGRRGTDGTAQVVGAPWRMRRKIQYRSSRKRVTAEATLPSTMTASSRATEASGLIWCSSHRLPLVMASASSMTHRPRRWSCHHRCRPVTPKLMRRFSSVLRMEHSTREMTLAHWDPVSGRREAKMAMEMTV